VCHWERVLKEVFQEKAYIDGWAYRYDALDPVTYNSGAEASAHYLYGFPLWVAVRNFKIKKVYVIPTYNPN